ncbi:orotate phosphoribosyltransferase [Bacillus sp. T33-2]|uniref:orotate phosphoribosyltransferase n=1 Tax=Bacillus sp. T33-2 TaxID=2054168 RepID=UPI000C78B8D5|nr:orotate phosphoribosyltransferase [Bacillus sp. T33-2]PLR97344.1 orotate phosphoribosyltransferase [Bacillus sp. T33-2]
MKKQIAARLLEIEAVFLRPDDPFTWSSGILSPIYCDNRLTLSYPAIRREIAEGLKELITTHFSECELIAGTATAGIPHAAWVSELLGMPMCYVRSKAKGHGKGNQIEGLAKPGQKTVIVEDLISTGGSVINAAAALKEAGCEVLGAVSIFTYELEKGTQLLAEAGLALFSLTDFSTLTEVAKEEGSIRDTDLEKLSSWRKDPESWGKA